VCRDVHATIATSLRLGRAELIPVQHRGRRQGVRNATTVPSLATRRPRFISPMSHQTPPSTPRPPCKPPSPPPPVTCNTTPAPARRSALRLEQGEDVVDPDGALDVSDDRTRGVVHELDADLGDTTTGSSAAEDLFRVRRGGEQRGRRSRMDGRKFVESEGEEMRRLSIREGEGAIDRFEGDVGDGVRVRGERKVVGERVGWKHDRSRVGRTRRSTVSDVLVQQLQRRDSR
jgi:hypothetical protein